MKKVLILALSAFLLTACGGGEAGKVSEEEFQGKIDALQACPYTAGESTVHVVQKQSGHVASDSQAAFTFAYQDNEWSITNSSGSGSATSFREFYLHTMANYALSIESFSKILDNITKTFVAKENYYSLTVKGKFDYANAYPTLGVTGKLDQVLTIKWDLYGMPTSWDATLKGNLNYQGQKISYEEVTNVSATWR